MIQYLVGKPEGKRPLGRPVRRWEDNIRMDLREVCWEGVHWIGLGQNRDHWRAVVKGNFLTSSVTISSQEEVRCME
jgi:hypothetical protein